MDDAKRIQPHSLENMGIPELEALLQKNFLATMSEDEPSNMEYMIKISEMIERKKAEAGVAAKTDADRAWKDFQELYRDAAEDMGAADLPEKPAAVVEFPGSRRTVRRVIIAAAIVAVLAAMSVVPIAGHKSVFQMIASWTEEQFTFHSDEDLSVNGLNDMPKGFDTMDTDKSSEYATIEEALADHGISMTILPQTLPDGFEQTILRIRNISDDDIRFFVQYNYGEQYVVYTVIQSNQLISSIHERTNAEVEPYQPSQELTFYLFSNVNNEEAVCYFDNIEISISTNLSRPEVKQLLDTIS